MVGAVALVLELLTHILGAVWTFFETCRISDTADRVPAPASVQGRVCDAQDHWLNVAPYVVLPASVVLAVVLAVLWWSSTRRWVGLTAPVWLAVVSTVALAVPGDTCSDATRRDQPAWACRTTGNG